MQACKYKILNVVTELNHLVRRVYGLGIYSTVLYAKKTVLSCQFITSFRHYKSMALEVSMNVPA